MRALCLGAAAICLAAALPVPGVASTSGDAVAYQINVAHNGRGTLKGFNGTLKLLWTETLAGPLSYPVITKTEIFVAAGLSPHGATVYALDIRNGNILWQTNVGGGAPYAALAYDQGQLFVSDSNGGLSAFNAVSGTLNWTTETNLYGPPVASNGIVFLGSGYGPYAYSEADGSFEWNGGDTDAGNGLPAVGGGKIFSSGPCRFYGNTLPDGNLLWADNEGCYGGGGVTDVFYDKKDYVRDSERGDWILDPSTGALIAPYSSLLAPTFFTLDTNVYGVGFVGELNCFDVATGETLWTFAGDGTLSSAPIGVNQFIIEGSSSGNLYVLKQSTGKVVWSMNLGASILYPDEGQIWEPLAGLAAAHGVLVVPASAQLFAFVAG